MPSSTSFPVSSERAALAIVGLTGPRGAPMLIDITLGVRRGGTHVVLGPIHSGKSLLLRHVVGLERAERGEIVIGGARYDARGESEDALLRLRRSIGVVFEGSALVSRLTILENVELPLLEHATDGDGPAGEAARALLDEVGVQGDLDATPDMLTRAGRRRVALARAMALRPPVLLLDEPTHGLDAHAAAEIDATIARLQQARGFAILLCSNDVRYAFGDADGISVLVGGRVIEQGDRATLERSEHDLVRRLLDRRGAA